MNPMISELEEVLRLSPQEDSRVLEEALLCAVWSCAAAYVPCSLQGHEPMPLPGPDGKALAVAFLRREDAQAHLEACCLTGRYAIEEIPLYDLMRQSAEVRRQGLMFNPSQEGCAVIRAKRLLYLYHTASLYTGGLPPREAMRFYLARLDTRANADMLARSQRCGCYRCRTMLTPDQISAFQTDVLRRRTALCPQCAEACVVPQHTDYDLSDALLEGMHMRFCDAQFSSTKDEQLFELFDRQMRRLCMEHRRGKA